MNSKTTNGWVILDKPYGMSSTQASNIVRRLTGASKAGHAGTLDPLATGVLPIALGEATKTIPYVVADVKQYSFQVTWGQERITDDAEGGIIATSDHRPSESEIRKVLPQFMGTIEQRPPLFSALKVKGKRAYDLARTGNADILKELQEAMILKTRPVEVYNLVLDSVDSRDQATLTLTCGPGTYVRSLARDIALTLGTVAFVSRLRRVQVGKFHQNDAILLENLKKLGHKSKMHRLFLPIGAVLDDIPAVPVSAEEAVTVYQGRRIPVKLAQASMSLVVLMLADRVVAIANGCDGYYYPKRVFN